MISIKRSVYRAKKTDEKDVFIFDINPGNDINTKDFLMSKLPFVIKYASLNNYIIFVSQFSSSIMKKFLRDTKLNNVFFISDSGAKIYLPNEKKYILNNPISYDDINAIHHHILMLDLTSIISFDKFDVLYTFSDIAASFFSKKQYLIPKRFYQNDLIIKLFQKYTCYSLNVYNQNFNILDQSIEKILKVINDTDLAIRYDLNFFFSITNKNVSKINSIYKLLEKLNFTNFEKIHYYAINSLSNDCYKRINDHYVCNFEQLDYRNFSHFKTIPVDIDFITKQITKILSKKNKNLKNSTNSLLGNKHIVNEKRINVKNLN